MDFSASEIKEKSIRGIKWVGLAEIIIRVLQIVSTIILARLLGPKTFGIFGICLIFFRLINAIGDLGFSAVIIQKPNIEKKLLDSVSILCVIFSTVICITLFFSANIIQSFFKYDNLVNPLKWFSFIFIIAALANIYRSLFIRNLNFVKLSIIEIFSFFLNAATSLYLAFQGMGIWSLIVGLYLENISQTILFIIYEDWVPRMRINLDSIKENIGFASKVLLARIAYFFNASIDKILIGKFLGEHSLGIYVIAYGLMDMPVQRVSKNVAKVAFPTLSKYQDNLSEFKETYKTITYYLSLVILAIFVGLIITADEFITLFYGPQWETMITPLRILCFVGIFRSFLVVSSTSLLALNKPGLEVKIAYLEGLFICVLMILLLQFGINGASLAIAGSYAVGILYSLSKLHPLIRITFAEYISLMFRPTMSTGIMLFVWITNIFAFRSYLNDLTFLIINVSLCGLAFTVFTIMMDRSLPSRVKRFLTVDY